MTDLELPRSQSRSTSLRPDYDTGRPSTSPHSRPENFASGSPGG